MAETAVLTEVVVFQLILLVVVNFGKCCGTGRNGNECVEWWSWVVVVTTATTAEAPRDFIKLIMLEVAESQRLEEDDVYCYYAIIKSYLHFISYSY